jgi:hypothetical protein
VTFPKGVDLKLPGSLPRHRRDADRYYTLVQAVALLHQAWRPIREHDGVPCIEATVDDFMIVDDLRRHVLDAGLAEIGKSAQDLLDHIRAHVRGKAYAGGIPEDHVTFTRADLIQPDLGWSSKRVRSGLDELVEHDRVIEVRGGGRRGLKCVYRLDHP